MSVYDKIKRLCEDGGFSVSNIGDYIDGVDITKGAVSRWKRGTQPSARVRKAIADYFGVDISYLYDDTDGVSVGHISGGTNVIGKVNNIGSGTTDNEDALLSLFRTMTIIQQAQVIAYASSIVEVKK